MKGLPLEISASGIHRGAMIDGSRGFQPTVMVGRNLFRRGATVESVASHGFMRRSATRMIVGAVVRGLKLTATIMQSLRAEDAIPMADAERAVAGHRVMFGVSIIPCRGAMTDGSRAFQRPDTGPEKVLRRIATLDVYRLRNKSRN